MRLGFWPAAVVQVVMILLWGEDVIEARLVPLQWESATEMLLLSPFTCVGQVGVTFDVTMNDDGSGHCS